MINIRLPGCVLGVIRAHPVKVAHSPKPLAAMLDALGMSLAKNRSMQALVEDATVKSVRAMFKSWNLDPSQDHPSSEALLYRFLKGPWPRAVNNVVDAANFCSAKHHLPIGIYDFDRTKGEIKLRLGIAGEKFQCLDMKEFAAAGKPVLADDIGPFGGPIYASTRTRVMLNTTSLLVVIFAPADHREFAATALEELGGILSDHASAAVTFRGVEGK